MLESLNYSFRKPKKHNLSNLPHQTVEKLQKNHGVLRRPQLGKQRWRPRLGILRVNIHKLLFSYLETVRTVILPVVLYGCETWSPTLRGEHRLREFENMVQRRIFGPQSDEIIGKCRRLFKEEFYDLQCSLNVIGVIKSRKWAGHVACIR